jgi:hypothetical protein
MASKRPHLSATGQQLQQTFNSNRVNPAVLRELLAELKHRTTPTSRALRKEVEDALAALAGKTGQRGSGSGRQDSPAPPPAPSPSPPPPSHQTLDCSACGKSLRVLIRSERTAYSCPVCKAEFETRLSNGVFQVVWVESKPPPKETSVAMTDALAREILGVASDADFTAIKAAWRRASQQYHPDKHVSLPERLRKAAETETKRINEAYRYLEGSTAADF